jgi:V/A-type H+-transporting ATPase subunit D
MNNLAVIPTHSAMLELEAERTLVDEAYVFLDEKRMLLAAEILRQLDDYEAQKQQIERLALQAGKLLEVATGAHGLQGISVYPALQAGKSEMLVRQRNFIGVTLATTELEFLATSGGLPVSACSETVEGQQCQQAFLELGKQSAVLAGIAGNLHRLLSEYRLTERRARALENVILPEIQQTLSIVRTQLEELDLEETVRARL